jgi:hypothetical protein
MPVIARTERLANSTLYLRYIADLCKIRRVRWSGGEQGQQPR